MPRFTHPWEKAASIRLRTGDEDVIATYSLHGRIRSGPREDLLDTLYSAWKTDTDEGKTSLMIAADLDTVADLNARARPTASPPARSPQQQFSSPPAAKPASATG